MLLDLSNPPMRGVYGRANRFEPCKSVLYRRKGPHGEFTIKVAECDDDREAAKAVVNRLYGWRGYGEHHQLAERASCTTFIASFNSEVVGTLTLTVDSPKRLNVDETFVDELIHIRSDHEASLCELTKFAFDPTVGSQPMLAALFHVIFAYGTQIYDCTDLLIEVNPRHVRFYETMLDFSRLGPLRTNASVNAPSQLLQLRVAEIERRIALFAGRDHGGRSLYPHFLGKVEERAVRRRIENATGRTRPSRPAIRQAA